LSEKLGKQGNPNSHPKEAKKESQKSVEGMKKGKGRKGEGEGVVILLMYGKLAITILVKFCDTEQLQQLTAHRQSRGVCCSLWPLSRT